jgi:hypothetical protein
MEPLIITNHTEARRFQAVVGKNLALLNYQIKAGVFQID